MAAQELDLAVEEPHPKRPKLVLSGDPETPSYLVQYCDIVVIFPPSKDGKRDEVQLLGVIADLLRSSGMLRVALSETPRSANRLQFTMPAAADGDEHDARVNCIRHITGTRPAVYDPRTSEAVVAWVIARIYYEVSPDAPGDIGEFPRFANVLSVEGVAALFDLGRPALRYQQLLANKYAQGSLDPKIRPATLPGRLFELCPPPKDDDKYAKRYAITVLPYLQALPSAALSEKLRASIGFERSWVAYLDYHCPK
jgi:hypothetical protein